MLETLYGKIAIPTESPGPIKSPAQMQSMMQSARKGQLTSGKEVDASGLSAGNGYITIQLSDEALVRPTAYGSPWGHCMWWGTPGKMAVQHCAPTADIWSMLWANQSLTMLHLKSRVSDTTWYSVSRNGFTSSVYSGYTSGWYVDDFIYWNTFTNQCERMTPMNMETTPQLFDGKLL